MNVCRTVKFILGAALIGYAYYSGIKLFYVGIPLVITAIAGICPLGKISKRCRK